MSTSLYFEPDVDRGKVLPDELKYRISPHLWDHDGTLGSKRTKIQLGSDQYYFIAGLAAAGVKGAGILIKAIQKHESVYVWTEG